MSFVTWYNEIYIESTCLLFCFDGLTLRTTIVDLTLIEVKRTIPKLSKIYRTQMSDNYSRLYFILMYLLMVII